MSLVVTLMTGVTTSTEENTEKKNIEGRRVEIMSKGVKEMEVVAIQTGTEKVTKIIERWKDAVRSTMIQEQRVHIILKKLEEGTPPLIMMMKLRKESIKEKLKEKNKVMKK